MKKLTICMLLILPLISLACEKHHYQKRPTPIITKITNQQLPSDKPAQAAQQKPPRNSFVRQGAANNASDLMQIVQNTQKNTERKN